jgi:hypothetical protein
MGQVVQLDFQWGVLMDLIIWFAARRLAARVHRRGI